MQKFIKYIYKVYYVISKSFNTIPWNVTCNSLKKYFCRVITRRLVNQLTASLIAFSPTECKNPRKLLIVNKKTCFLIKKKSKDEKINKEEHLHVIVVSSCRHLYLCLTNHSSSWCTKYNRCGYHRFKWSHDRAFELHRLSNVQLKWGEWVGAMIQKIFLDKSCWKKIA